MEGILESDEEQFQMLQMVLEDVKCGICMFQSEEQSKWVGRIQKEHKGRKLAIHNIADDDEDMGMPDIQDFSRWAVQSDADIVVVYNLQLLGLRSGDSSAVERLNAMRDQIQNLGKLFLLGCSPYFGLLLARNARDLYSCIRYHFRFSGSSAKMGEAEDCTELGGDDMLAVAEYWEYKGRAKGSGEADKIQRYLACMECWLRGRGNLPFREREDIRKMAVFVDQFYRRADSGISDVASFWLIADIWLELEEAEKAFYWYQLATDKIQGELGTSHKLYGDSLVHFGNYYEKICDLGQCEKNYSTAITIYQKEGMAIVGSYKKALVNMAILYRKKCLFRDALDIYGKLLQHDTEKYGSDYYGNAVYLNNRGCIYEDLSEDSKALESFQAALGLAAASGKRSSLLITLYHNMANLYLKNEDTRNAGKYMQLAKKETGQLC